MTISTDFLIIAGFILFGATLVHGSVGFGFPMLATPLLAMYTSIPAAIALTLIPSIVINLISIISEDGAMIAFKRFLPLAVAAMAGSAIGTRILLVANSD